MAVSVQYVTDPACPWSWASEPGLCRLEAEFGDELEWTFVMGGLARDLREQDAALFGRRGRGGLVQAWLQAGADSGMPVDPLLWSEAPLTATYPACMAVKAAAEQGPDAGRRYLRALRQGIMCLRRKLDGSEALVEEARGAGLDTERFRIDLASHASVEAFGADLERAGAAQEAEAGQRCSRTERGVPLPALGFRGADGHTHWVAGFRAGDEWRSAALAAGAAPHTERPAPEELLRRLGRVTVPELAAACELPLPRAHAELWRLVAEWRARPLAAGGGHLFEAA